MINFLFSVVKGEIFVATIASVNDESFSIVVNDDLLELPEEVAELFWIPMVKFFNHFI
jgi:hypothetical protein